MKKIIKSLLVCFVIVAGFAFANKKVMAINEEESSLYGAAYRVSNSKNHFIEIDEATYGEAGFILIYVEIYGNVILDGGGSVSSHSLAIDANQDDGSGFFARITNQRIVSYSIDNANRSITAYYSITYRIINLNSQVLATKTINDSIVIRY